MTRPEICLIDGGSHALREIDTLLSNCGFITWNGQTMADFESRVAAQSTLCLIIDLPGLVGLTLLEALRKRAVRVPAIVVAAPDLAVTQKRLAALEALEIFARPVPVRQLLTWIECLSIAQIASHRPHRATAWRGPQALAQILSAPL